MQKFFGLWLVFGDRGTVHDDDGTAIEWDGDAFFRSTSTLNSDSYFYSCATIQRILHRLGGVKVSGPKNVLKRDGLLR